MTLLSKIGTILMTVGAIGAFITLNMMDERNKNDQEYFQQRYKTLRSIIAEKDSLLMVSRNEQRILQYKYDSLELQKNKTKIIYREKLVYINTLSAAQLDSLIRAAIAE